MRKLKVLVLLPLLVLMIACGGKTVVTGLPPNVTNTQVNAWATASNDLKIISDDLCGLKAGVTGLLAVQATDKSNVSHRVRKIQASEIAKLWLLCGNQIQVHGWKDGSLRCLKLELAGKEIVAMPL